MKFILLLIVHIALPLALHADEALTETARRIFADKQDCVLWVSAVAKTSYSAEGSADAPRNIPDQENKVDALGTIIETNGLVVASLSQIDPSRMISGRTVRGMRFDAVTTLNDVKVTLGDGTEIPAELIMKDADLDLAFLKIKLDSKEARGVTLKSVNLSDSATGNMLDRTITVSRMDEVLNRVGSVAVGEINMITKKPRVFMRAGGAMTGCPTFLANGKLLGITTARIVKNRNPVGVLLPAADILEIAEQAKQSKPEETKPEKN
jgi:hypothetical protein